MNKCVKIICIIENKKNNNNSNSNNNNNSNSYNSSNTNSNSYNNSSSNNLNSLELHILNHTQVIITPWVLARVFVLNLTVLCICGTH